MHKIGTFPSTSPVNPQSDLQARKNDTMPL